MRKVTSEAVESLMNGIDYKCGNTKVAKLQDGRVVMYLHGNPIAVRTANCLRITNCGYFTATTKERLNGLPNVSIRQIKGEWYLNGKYWDGRIVKVTIK